MTNIVLSKDQKNLLKQLAVNSAQKGNLANSGLVLEGDQVIASAESLVISNTDATAHSERMLVEQVCKLKQANYTPGLTMVTVCEPCLMCLSACAWAGYKSIAFIIPAKKYVNKIPWMTDNSRIDKVEIGKTFNNPVEIIHLNDYETEFSEMFEEQMKELLT